MLAHSNMLGASRVANRPELSGTSRNIMGDLYLSRQGQLQSRIPITAFFICIREKRKKLSFYLCPGDNRLSTAFDSPTRTGETRDHHASTEGQTAPTQIEYLKSNEIGSLHIDYWLFSDRKS